jgi:hypothetical protein
VRKVNFLVILLLILAIFLTGCGVVPPLNQSPIASFTADITPAVITATSVYFEVHFDASSSNGSIVSYAWNFNDSDPNLSSNTGKGQTIDWDFSFSGNYNVEITIIDNEILQASIIIVSWEQSGDSVTIYYEIENTGSVDIDFYEVWFTIKCTDDSEYIGWTVGSDLKVGDRRNAFGLVDVGEKTAESVKIKNWELTNYDL